jgi:hypothetical protein
MSEKFEKCKTCKRHGREHRGGGEVKKKTKVQQRIGGLMKILVACEESQAVTIEFRKRGHEAYSCDILPCSGGHPEWHLQQDVTELLKQDWDMVIAFPPCTYLSKAGACRLYKTAGIIDEERYKKGIEAKNFFMQFYNLKCNKIAIENPVSLKVFDMPKWTQEIEPYQFGHPFSKRTRLWLRRLPLLKPTNIVEKLGTYLPSSTKKMLILGKTINARETRLLHLNISRYCKGYG